MIVPPSLCNTTLLSAPGIGTSSISLRSSGSERSSLVCLRSSSLGHCLPATDIPRLETIGEDEPGIAQDVDVEEG